MIKEALTISFYTFIASDYPLSEVVNDKIKRYKVLEGASIKSDDSGSLYYYKEGYEKDDPRLFILCQPGDQCNVMKVESEEDFHELTITKEKANQNARDYTNKEHLYAIDVRFNNRRGQQLLDYLLHHIKNKPHQDATIDICTIWIGEKESLETKSIKSSQLRIEDLEKIFQRTPKQIYTGPYCIQIS